MNVEGIINALPIAASLTVGYGTTVALFVLAFFAERDTSKLRNELKSRIEEVRCRHASHACQMRARVDGAAA